MDDSLEQESEEEPEKYCPQCMRMLPPDTEYCPLCGTRAEIETSTTATTAPMRVGHAFLITAGVISLLGGIANFAAAASTSFYIASAFISTSVLQSLITLIAMLFAMAILCILGSAFGWSAGLHLWKRRRLRKTQIEITIQAAVGFLTIIEGASIQSNTIWGPVFTFIIGFPVLAFSLVSLILTGLTGNDQNLSEPSTRTGSMVRLQTPPCKQETFVKPFHSSVTFQP